MVLKKSYGAWVKKTEESRKRLAREPYIINALAKMRKKGIIVDWTKPEEKVKETLTNGLKEIGENKYVADQAAKEIYLAIAPAISGKKSSLIILNSVSKKDYKREGYKTDRIGGRFENNDFRKLVLRTAEKMGPEFSRIMMSPKARDGRYVDAVKLSQTFWDVVGKMSPADTERLALELAREFKARRGGK